MNSGIMLTIYALTAIAALSITVAQNPPIIGTFAPLNRRIRDLSDPELYVADYYPQAPPPAPLELPRYSYQFEDRNFRPSDEDYMRPDDSYLMEFPMQYNNRALEKNLLEYLEKIGLPKDDSLNKRVLSSFRERMEREKSKEEHEKLAELFLQKLQEEVEDQELERERDYDNRDYMDMIEELWEKYKKSRYDKDAPIFVEDIKKRQIPADYSTLGWSGVGYIKRSSPDMEDDENNRLRYNLIQPLQSDYVVQRPELYNNYPSEYLYAKRKRFPVAKRSSNFYSLASHHKRGVNREQLYKKNSNKKYLKTDSASGTDPKIVKDLSNIFGSKDLKNNMTKKTTNIKEKKNANIMMVTSTPLKNTTSSISELKNHPHMNNKQKEHVSELVNNVPLNIKKKSIDWSNYFGIDRRKKKSESFSNANDIDNDWVIKRYNKAVEMAVKRSSEYPLNIFRNHGSVKESDALEVDDNNELQRNRKQESKSDEKLRDMDDKLKTIEDLIIDEALKYTGAHEGETDPSELQEVKDKVISRLAAAYSLEKMRRALSEFKTSLTSQKYKAKNSENENTQETENVLKKKSTETEKKCTSKGACEVSEFPDQTINEIETQGFSTNTNSLNEERGRCNTIEDRCRRLVNDYNGLFYSICKWHQLCYLCNIDNNSAEETTACDLMFLSRADALCKGDVICQWAARPALNFMRDIQNSAPKELATRCDRNMCNLSE